MEDDLTQGILFGTPDMTTEEEQQMRLQAEQSAQDMQIMESMAQQQMLQQEAAAQQSQCPVLSYLEVLCQQPFLVGEVGKFCSLISPMNGNNPKGQILVLNLAVAGRLDFLF